jgi:ATP-binding cassette subfamily B protein
MRSRAIVAGLRHFEDPGFLARLRLAEEAAHEAPQELASLATSLFRAAASVVTLTAVVAAVAPAIAGLLLVVGGVGLSAQLLRGRRATSPIDRPVSESAR